MRSTMQDGPLLISGIVRHGSWLYADKQVVTCEPDGYRSASFAQIVERSERLAKALRHLGVGEGDRVGTFCWNNQEHLEAYLAVPSMGAVLHTLNIRLFPEQLAYVINHAGDKVVIIDGSLIPVFAKIRGELTTVETIIVRGPGDTDLLGATLDYDELIGAQEPGFDWPDLDERAAAAMCYTSGTTGNPKGVVYSHRSTWLHSMASTMSNGLGISERDRCLLIVPMFHANGWGVPYTALLAGCELVMPQHLLQGSPLVRIINDTKPTLALGVPTIWNDLLHASDMESADLSCLRSVLAGGSAVPRTLIEAFADKFGVPMLQGWGMTETSPLAAVAIPPLGCPEDEEIDYRVKAGRIVFGVQIRTCDEDGVELPRDGESVGEFEVRGPWITASYYASDDPEKFHDGWLRTGDVGALDAEGFMTISDRTKDVIKSGGEWISSVELENEVMAHPCVVEAAVIAIPDERWAERPLVCVVTKQGETAPTPEELVAFLTPRVAKWWLPDQWTFIAAIPRTSVGKFDKKVLRAQYAKGELDVVGRGGAPITP
jgi:fatty-acyl-CoA synthase